MGARLWIAQLDTPPTLTRSIFCLTRGWPLVPVRTRPLPVPARRMRISRREARRGLWVRLRHSRDCGARRARRRRWVLITTPGDYGGRDNARRNEVPDAAFPVVLPQCAGGNWQASADWVVANILVVALAPVLTSLMAPGGVSYWRALADQAEAIIEAYAPRWRCRLRISRKVGAARRNKARGASFCPASSAFC